MSAAVREFLDFWVQNSVHAAEQYGAKGGNQETGDLVAQCTEMAASQGITLADIEAEVGDLQEFIEAALVLANETEDKRPDRHRN